MSRLRREAGFCHGCLFLQKTFLIYFTSPGRTVILKYEYVLILNRPTQKCGSALVSFCRYSAPFRLAPGSDDELEACLQHRRDPRLVPWGHSQEVSAPDPESDGEECTETCFHYHSGSGPCLCTHQSCLKPVVRSLWFMLKMQVLPFLE